VRLLRELMVAVEELLGLVYRLEVLEEQVGRDLEVLGLPYLELKVAVQEPLVLVVYHLEVPVGQEGHDQEALEQLCLVQMVVRLELWERLALAPLLLVQEREANLVQMTLH